MLSQKLHLPISVIVPVAGRPKLIQDALYSILNQSIQVAEILVILNHPDPLIHQQDQEVIIKCQNQNKAKNIYCINETIVGPAAARNTGIKNASQEWIAFLDSDDQWHPNKLELQYQYLQKRPHLVACHTSEQWIKNEISLNQPLELQARVGQFLLPSLHNCLISPSSILIHKQKLVELGCFDELYPVCEDFELWLRFLIKQPIGLLTQKLTIKYSGAWAQLSTDTHSMDQWRIQAILKLLNNNTLSKQQRTICLNVCEKKISILKQGYLNRNKEMNKKILSLIKQLKDFQ